MDVAGDESWPYSHVETVRWADLDPMRHLNNVAFLRFFENARIGLVSPMLGKARPEQPADFDLIFAECHINYRAPAFFEEQIRTFVRVGDIRRSSFRVHFLMRSERDDRVLADGWGALVGYDYAAGRSVPIPDEVGNELHASHAARISASANHP
jgi:acyl-CoA thioester hydrolase